jgi:cell division protein FtsQ
MSQRPILAQTLSVLAVAAVLLMLIGVYFARTGGAGFLPLRFVDVTGPFERVSDAQIRDAVAQAAARGFLFTELDEVRDRVMALPWIETVEVRKEWPDVLAIRVTERKVIGRSGDGLVDVSGALFPARGEGELRGLPRFTASAAKMPALVAFYQAVRHIIAGTERQIVALDMSARGAIELRLSSDVLVRLGSRDQEARFERFIASLDALASLDPRPIMRADLRYTHGFAVRYADPQSMPAPAQLSTHSP